jgi:drug/metabolite transporter (DMT)-like permease
LSALALALVVVAALLHAGWNYALKRSGGGPGVVALASLLTIIIFAPFALAAAWWGGYRPQPTHFVLMAGSGAIHTAYFLLLDRAYRSGGDLSMVYPLARASGPLLTIAVAIAVLGERPGPLALAGAVLIGVSALLLAGNPLAWRWGRGRSAAGFALLTGCTIAAYTVWDKVAVATWLVPPLVYNWGYNACLTAVLLPWTRARAPGAVTAAWRTRRGTAFAIAIMSPVSYLLVLIAMVFTPVSLVAPAREVSILFAALMGAHLLREGDGTRRLVAAGGMVLGIAGLALG